jgi:hypothetical protein
MEYLVPSLRIVAFTDMDDPGALFKRGLHSWLNWKKIDSLQDSISRFRRKERKAYHDRHIKKKAFKTR